MRHIERLQDQAKGGDERGSNRKPEDDLASAHALSPFGAILRSI